jgi:TM2 domain-containing membrane protein YozV
MKQDSELQQVPLKNPVAAALLSFLLPGAGQLYQGRIFKGVVNCVCVMTLMFWGLSLGEWGIVFRLEPLQANERDIAQLQGGFQEGERLANPDLEPDRSNTKTHLGFLAQAPIGLISIPAMIQEKRYYSDGNISAVREEFELNAAAIGKFAYRSDKGERVLEQFEGTLELSPQQGEFGREMQGTFSGTDPQGKKFEVTIEGLNSIGPPIGSEPYQPLTCFVSHLNGQPVEDGVLLAGIERGWLDRVFVPPNIQSLEHLHGKLGKKFPLAEVFTWIAGLLNVLVIWDAYAGPAYGYRMPRPEEQTANEDKPDEKTDAPPPAEASTPTTKTA